MSRMSHKEYIDKHTQARGKADRAYDVNSKVSNGAASQAYRDNYDATFHKKPEMETCKWCGDEYCSGKLASKVHLAYCLKRPRHTQ